MLGGVNKYIKNSKLEVVSKQRKIVAKKAVKESKFKDKTRVQKNRNTKSKKCKK